MKRTIQVPMHLHTLDVDEYLTTSGHVWSRKVTKFKRNEPKTKAKVQTVKLKKGPESLGS